MSLRGRSSSSGARGGGGRVATTGICIDAGAIMHKKEGGVNTPYPHFEPDPAHPLERSAELGAAVRTMLQGDTIEQNEAAVADIITFGRMLGQGGNGIVFDCALKNHDGSERVMAIKVGKHRTLQDPNRNAAATARLAEKLKQEFRNGEQIFEPLLVRALRQAAREVRRDAGNTVGAPLPAMSAVTYWQVVAERCKRVSDAGFHFVHPPIHFIPKMMNLDRLGNSDILPDSPAILSLRADGTLLDVLNKMSSISSRSYLVVKEGQGPTLLWHVCAWQLLLAVRFITSSGLCHVDIKPENVMVRGDEANPAEFRCMLGDFGGIKHAKDKDVRQPNTQFYGTFAYVPPIRDDFPLEIGVMRLSEFQCLSTLASLLVFKFKRGVDKDPSRFRSEETDLYLWHARRDANVTIAEAIGGRIYEGRENPSLNAISRDTPSSALQIILTFCRRMNMSPIWDELEQTCWSELLPSIETVLHQKMPTLLEKEKVRMRTAADDARNAELFATQLACGYVFQERGI